MTHRVHILPAAEREFERQFRYIAKRSRRGAVAWQKAFLKTLKSLEQNAGSQPLAPEDGTYESEIRQILFKTRRGLTYRVLFTVRQQEVFLLHIRGPGQDVMSADDMELPP